jgi:DNA-directed RNA polymerase subunit beta'
MLTLPPKTLVPKKAYSNIGELKSDYKALKISVIDVVTIGKNINTVGRFLANDALPIKYQTKDIVLDKNGLGALLLKVAHEDPKEYGSVISKLKDLGNQSSYSTGLSFGIKDLRLANSSVIKAEFLKMEKDLIAAKDPVKWVRNFAANDMKSSIILKEVHDDLKKKDSGLYHLLQSSLGSKKNQVEQMLAGPMFVTDHKGDPVPVLIKNSYVDGLTAAEYWTTMAGVRKGMMDRALETMDTGAFSKEVINSGLYGKITEHDCGTDEGILVSLKDKPVHYLDRYASKGNVGIKAQTLITKDVLKNYKGESIRVRSPLTCKARHQPCAMCFGLKENCKLPSIGDAIGVISAQSLSEPSVQLGMRTFHSGGAVGAQSISGFDRAKQLVELPKVVPDKAALAESSGTVSKVSEAPQGGHYISVGGNIHYSLMKPTVKEGDKVHRGDTLSLGNVKPQELAELKGTLDAKQYIVNEVVKLYEDAGRTIRRPLVETAIGQIIRYAQITDPGESDTTVGDYLPVNEIEFRNKSLKKKIIYKEIVKGIGLAPFKSEDFLARLNFERIPEVIQRGAAMGWKSEIHGTHPVPGYAYGAEYGQKPTPGAKSPEKQIALPILFKKK